MCNYSWTTESPERATASRKYLLPQCLNGRKVLADTGLQRAGAQVRVDSSGVRVCGLLAGEHLLVNWVSRSWHSLLGALLMCSWVSGPGTEAEDLGPTLAKSCIRSQSQVGMLDCKYLRSPGTTV